MNMSSQPTTIVYFRISHVDHAVMKDPALQSMWLEYKYASLYLDDENAGICMNEDTLDAYDINVVHEVTHPHALATPLPPPPASTTASQDVLGLSPHPVGYVLAATPASSTTSYASTTTAQSVNIVTPARAVEATRNFADEDDADADTPLLSHTTYTAANTAGDVELQPLVRRDQH